MSEEQPNEWLKAKAVLLDAIEDLRREAENDGGLEHAVGRVQKANKARWNAYYAWQAHVRVGRRFGELIVIELAERRKNGPLWQCRCDCGRLRVVRAYKLRRGEIMHCGKCHPPYAVRQINDLVGQRFGELVVIGMTPLNERPDRQSRWLCRCDCGGIISARATRLNGGEVWNCGCRPQGFIDLTGQRIGSLTVIERAENDGYGKAKWLCLCDCGNTVVVTRAKLRSHRNKRTLRCPECQRTHATTAQLQTMRTAFAQQLSIAAIERRDETLAAGGRPCSRCGAPLRSARPVCRSCIQAAKDKARAEACA